MRTFLLALAIIPALVFGAARNVVPLSSAAQMQGGNTLSQLLPAEKSTYAVQAIWTGATLAGNILLQASLDNSNWTTVTGSSQAVSGTGSFIWNVGSVGYPYTRLNYTPTSTNEWTVQPVADPGVAQVQVVTAIADTCKVQVVTAAAVADVGGSLNNKYFLLSGFDTGTGTRQDYYVWFNINSAGTDPLVANRTAIPVTGATNASANTLGSAMATAIAAKSGFASASNGSGTVTITANNCGAIPVPTDGPTALNRNTGFTFGTTTAGVDSNLNNKYFTLSSINSSTKAQKNFYVWFNVNSKGTSPGLAGKTAVPITVASGGTSANTIGGSIATALAALTNDFASASNSSGAVTITNAKVGAVPAAADSVAATGFTFATPSTAGVNSLNNTYFTFYSGNNATCYYLWFSIDSLGTDPAVASCTAVPITGSHGATASTLGTAMATAIAALNSTNDFTASGTTTVTVTNKAAGPSTFPADSGTGFTFTGTTGSGSLTSYISY